MRNILFKLGVISVRLKMYLDSGQTVVIYCESFEVTKLSGSKARELEIKRANCNWTVDVEKINAITAKTVIFRLL